MSISTTTWATPSDLKMRNAANPVMTPRSNAGGCVQHHREVTGGRIDGITMEWNRAQAQQHREVDAAADVNYRLDMNMREFTCT